ncbi:hypothetical protein FBEOM_2974 [Fusarium beomiforme]|uniref:Uncharacterized protein n=1 Tax=Fusarium beomiforme TaxID=44412 RepID=A0A9P5AQK3_9HYPO|nr:hypothetical protein FBEOM_2974 [Fusarium beomiforme]
MELFHRHRVTNIPSDQKALLERPDSWAVELQNTPHGLSQVPGHVLESVKATYVANKEILQERTPISKKRSGSPPASPSNKRRRNGNASTPESDHANLPQSSPVSSSERAVSWSPTPSPKRGPSKDSECIAAAAARGHNTQSSIVHETPKTGFAGPPRPASGPIIEIPPSSEETEEDLETRIPDAQPLHNGSINRAAVRSKPTAPSPLSTNRTMATPPCAQPSNTAQTIVPNTVFANKENLQANGSPKNNQPHRLKFKPIDVDDVGRKRRKSHNEKDRLPPTIMPSIINSSIPTSSDSIVPYSGVTATTQEYIRQSIEEKEEDETMDHIEEIVPSTNLQGSTVDRPVIHHQPKTVGKREPHDRDGQKSNNEAKSTQQRTTSSQMDPSKATGSTNSQAQINEQIATRQSPVPAPLIAPGAPLGPYEAFVQQYPDYPGDNGGDKLPGTKSNFIYACVYLNYLRPRKELRDCLYDDFIRAFPCSYREGNLSHILRSYPEEFAHANELISKKDGDDAGEDDISIYTSSDDEGIFEEANCRRSISRSSHHSSDRKKSVESHQPITTIERDMDIDLPEIPPAPPSNSSRRRSSMASTNDLTPKYGIGKKATPILASSRDLDSTSTTYFTRNATNINVTTIYYRFNNQAEGSTAIAVFQQDL